MGGLLGSNIELACCLHIRSAREQLGHSAQVPLVSWLPCASPYPAPLFYVIRCLVLVHRLGVVDFYWEGDQPHIDPPTFRAMAVTILRNEWFLYLGNGP